MSRFIPTALIFFATNCLGTQLVRTDEFPLTLDNINIRDPFIHADASTETYYLYAQTGNRKDGRGSGAGVEVYRSRDLVRWNEPELVFKRPDEFWGGEEIWAPEMHKLGKQYYLFVSLNGREGGRGTQILRANSPAGPFEVFSPKANTPPEQRSLDGTPFIDPDGQNWMVYCHEWVQIGDGAMRAVPMADGWSGRLDEPIHLFSASDAPWAKPLGMREGKYVTDGCFLHRLKSGHLLMLWSTFTGEKGRTYAVGIAHSESDTIRGPWKHEPEPIFAGNGGHPMLFRTFDGQLTLALHQPNSGEPARVKLFRLAEARGTLKITPWNPPL